MAKVHYVVWNTEPTNRDPYFCVQNGLDEQLMLSIGWTVDHTVEQEFEPKKPDIAATVAFLQQKIEETQAAADKAKGLLFEKIRNLQALTYED